MDIADLLFRIIFGFYGISMMVIMIIFLYYFLSIMDMLHRGDREGAKKTYKKIYGKDLG